MGSIVGLDGKALGKDGKPEEVPGLDLADPVGSLDLLGPVARGNYMMAQQYGMLAQSKHNKEIRIPSRNVASIAGQAATVCDFASNAVAELAFTLAEAESRIAVLLGMIPEDKLEEAKKTDMLVGVEWENRRRLFSMRVPVLMRKKERLGLALAQGISGEAPTAEDFAKVTEEAVAAGFKPITEEDVKAQNEAKAKAEAKADDDAPVALSISDVPKAKVPAKKKIPKEKLN